MGRIKLSWLVVPFPPDAVHGRDRRINTTGPVQDLIGAGGNRLGFQTARSGHQQAGQMFSVRQPPAKIRDIAIINSVALPALTILAKF